MPELPEVETIVRDLRRLVSGATIRRASVSRPDLIIGSPATFEDALANRRIREVDRRAKNIVIRLNGDRLIVNLGMTGRVLVLDRDAANPPHTGAQFELADGRTIVYQDVRRFGRLEVIPADAWDIRTGSMGVEPLSEDFTPDLLLRIARLSRVAVKTWLMDQKRVVGVGNIYASEALFRAKVNPRKAAKRLTKREVGRLHQAIRDVLQEAIDFRGTTLLDYRDPSGERGGFAARLRVYDREGEPCVNCGSPIRRIVQAGRSTFYCPSCQR
jgi:formamidopyrimidine-DNA glycosylase